MGGSLTVSERIMYHLSSFVKYEDKYEVPFHLTQDGISGSCGISRAHAAIELKKLRASGLVDERLSHVRRGKTRRKVYLLSHAGKARATAILQYVRDNDIDPQVDASSVPTESAAPSGRRRHRSSPMPSLKHFFGRDRELAALGRALEDPAVRILSLKGIPGIGKTSLAVKLLSGVSRQRIFWYAVRPWDTPRSVAEALGEFFSENGSRGLENYLASGSFELGEISFLLKELLAENGYIFAFDDADMSDGVQEFLAMFRHSSGPGKMLVTTEGGSPIYDRSEVVAKGEVEELEVTGLDADSAMRLLAVRGIDGAVARELVQAANGHPLSLEMVTESAPTEARYQLSRYFEERFYEGLPDDQKSLLQLASVFQKPFPADAIPRGLRGVRKGSMLREVAPGRFEIHASLREFVYGCMSAEERFRWHSAAADHYLRAGEPQERLLHLLRANRRLEGEMLISRLGEELMADGNVQRLWQSLRDYEPTKDRYRPDVRLAQARLACVLGVPDTAETLLEEVSGAEGDGLRAEAMVELGGIEYGRGSLDRASELFAQALALADGNLRVTAKATRGLGSVESRRGRYEKAKELFERSAQDSLSSMDQNGMLKAHLELGKMLIDQGDYETAIDHFSKCAAGFGPVDLASVYMNMGVAHSRLGKVADARRHLENAVSLSAETGQPRTSAYAQLALAEALVGAGEPADARERCFEALEVLSELDDRPGMSSAYAALGESERLLGNEVPCEEYLTESAKTLEGSGRPGLLAQRKLDLGRLLASNGRGEAARVHLEEALELSGQAERDDLESEIREELRRIESDDGGG